MNILLKLCALFYSVLCIFSIVTGLMYAQGKRKLNPLELSDSFMAKLDSEEKLMKFAKKMGWVTFVVGIVQGITAFSILKWNSGLFYFIGIGFTLFSICSVAFKLKGKINFFPLSKAIAYVAILIVLVMNL